MIASFLLKINGLALEPRKLTTRGPSDGQKKNRKELPSWLNEFLLKRGYMPGAFLLIVFEDRAPDQRTNTHTTWQIDSSLRGTMA